MATKKKTKKRPSPIAKARKRLADLRERRPHKSFQLTRRRDIPKRPELPGYLKFTGQVLSTIFTYKKHYAILFVIYVVLAVVFIAVAQQQQYRLLVDSINEFGSDLLGSQLELFPRTLGLFGVAISGGLNTSLDVAQQFYLVLVTLITWLVLIWLLRQLLAGNVVKVRDGLYNGPAPLIPTVLIGALMVVQALPGMIGIYIFTIATQNAGLEGVIAMLFGLIAILLVLLSLYWVASSIFALLIVALPGTYPVAAIRAAGDLAVGRRVSLMLRMLWLILLLLLVWVLLLGPALLLDHQFNFESFPFIPFVLQILGAISLLFGTTYLYLLYREMINESAK
jgi:hypothetical protein